MSIRLSIGDFSRMTYLSIKALRRYHEMGLLVPADVDPASGYRYYDASQVPAGQVVRRFRDLGMPLEQVKEVLLAPDAATRNELIVAHLRQMESALEQTQHTVASLRALLERPRSAISVEYRSVGATTSLAIAEPVSMDDLESWWAAAFDELHDVLHSTDVERAGPGSALYASEFFEEEIGEVVAFIPVTGRPEPWRRTQPRQIPAAELAVTLYRGPFSELDQAYGALGTFVAEREIGLDGPIWERYLVSSAQTDDESLHQTEVGWPVFHTRRQES
jgi:DNA-binding transcriptional MerR regulator